MLAGFARIDITPDLKGPALFNLGYWNERAIRFTGVRDRIFVRCAALGTGSERIFWISVESLFDSFGFGATATAAIVATFQLAAERVWIACTHAHSTPLVGLNQTQEGSDYGRFVADAIVRAAHAAVRNQVSACARWSEVRVPGLLYNRRPLLANGRVAELHTTPQPNQIVDAGVVNDRLSLLQFHDGDGRLVGGICHFGIHGVCIQCSPLISGDCMGQAVRRLEQNAANDPVVLFFNGAIGDVDPASMGDASALAQTAQALHEAMAAALHATLQPVTLDPVQCRAAIHVARRRAVRSAVELATRRDALRERAADQAANRHHSGAGYEYFLLGEELALASLPETVSIPIQVWRAGDTLWIGVAGELFTETGLALARALAPLRAFVVGYTGGWQGYFPPRAAFEQGGYEVAPAVWSRVAPGETEKLVARLLELADTVAQA